MSITVSMPQLGETVTEGTILRWAKQPGDTVAVDEVLFEVSTDKVDTEVPSPAAGVVLEILVPEGQTVAVGTPLAVIGEAVEAAAAPAVEVPAAPRPAEPRPEPTPLGPDSFAETGWPEPPQPAAREVPPAPVPEAPAAPAPGAGPFEISMEVEAAASETEPKPAVPTDVGFLSPVVRKLASEYGVDLSAIEGTGRNGRITRKDVQAFVDAQARGGEPARAAPEPAVVEPAVVPTPPVAGAEAEPIVPHPPGPERIEVPAELLEAVAEPEEVVAEPEEAVVQPEAPEAVEIMPTEPVAAPPEAEVVPVEPVAAPPEAEVVPTEPVAAPPEAEVVPVEPVAAPPEAEVVPVEPVPVPIEPEARPAAPARRAGLGRGLDALIPTEVAVPLPPHPERPAEVPPGIPLRPGDSVKDPTRLRMRIAEHMIRNRRTAAHVWTSMEVDFETVEQVRRRHQAEFKAQEGFALTYMPFIARATIDALGAFPVVNSSFYFEEQKIVEHGRVNLGVAVDLDQEGLVVMNIPGADNMRMRELARRIRAVAEKARSGDLTPDDVAGSTFTITNPGPFGTFMSAPIINVPEVAILSTDTVTRRPVAVVDDTGSSAIAVHHTGYLGLTWDHRAFDGSTAARFVRRIKENLETWDWEHELA
jgi:pyruvate dehydrogenase E2 component (dihydrolipoamide acetyltransferase)